MPKTKAPRSERKPPPESESESWRKLPWRKLEQHVYRIQKRMCAMRRTEVSLA
jgi:RNA-directed DNA polymerase